MARRLTTFILAGLVLGILVGWAINAGLGHDTPAETARLGVIADRLSLLTTIFLRLIKMVIAPLVFSTLVVGIASMGDVTALGRVGGRALGWFVGASLVSLTLGLAMYHLSVSLADLFGVSTTLTPPAANAAAAVKSTGFNLADFVTHAVPQSMVEAMANNEVLQIVIFSVFVGVAIAALGERARALMPGIEALASVMLRITDYVMRFAPVAVFASVASAIARDGPAILGKLAWFMGSFYAALIVLWAVLAGAAFLVLGGRAAALLRLIREPLLIGFSTASSEAAFPRTLEALERFGVPNRIASFVLPLGYSFNLDGSMIYMSFASLFIASAYGIHLSLGEQVTMLLVLMVTSKGIAGVPRASLVVIAAVLPLFHVPEAGIGLILAVDHFLDMGRTATNVVGNAVAASVVARWEGELGVVDEPAMLAGTEAAA